ncbi:MAG: LuxR C-terminal-related transcriptional regulator [Gemmatimonadaceae bacterium]
MLESELFALLEHTANAVYTVSATGEICSWNAAAVRVLGYPANEVLNRDVDEVLQARDVLGTPPLAGGVDASTRHWEASSGGTPNFDMQVRTRAGTWLWVNVCTIVFDNPRTGRQLYVRLLRDVDQLRRNEEKLNRLVDAARQLVALTDETPSHHAPVEALSDQERRILKLFAKGSNAAAIARELTISTQTLRNHLHHINRKLRTHNRLEAVTHAQRRGLLD